MNRLFYGIAMVFMLTTAAFGCKITLINDTDTKIFAFDTNYNEGDVIEPGAQAAYGAEGRHPNVIIYMLQAKPGEDAPRFQKAYKVEQKQCALYEEDKIAPMSKVISNSLPSLYEVINLANETAPLPCCHHEGHDPALDMPDEHLEREKDAE